MMKERRKKTEIERGKKKADEKKKEKKKRICYLKSFGWIVTGGGANISDEINTKTAAVDV